MSARRATQWSRYASCPSCGVAEGERCESVGGRWISRPHPERHRIGYLPTARQARPADEVTR